MRVFVKNLGAQCLPSYATEGSAGFDLRACLKEPLTIAPKERVRVPTGIAISIEEEGYGGFIFARSGLALNHGITLPNGVGVIDRDYRGEIMVALTNLSDTSYTIQNGDRIAQMVIMPAIAAEFIEVPFLGNTERGTGGFGSTGK
jgi:dUTP pyrophosphatase